MTLGIAIALVLGSVLAAILVEAYKSRMRRANPYSKYQNQEPPMTESISAAPPEQSLNDVQALRDWDIKLARAVASLTDSAMAPWHVYPLPHPENNNWNDSWAHTLTGLQTCISAARMLTADIATGDHLRDSYLVQCGKTRIVLTDHKVAVRLQQDLKREIASVIATYVQRRLVEIRGFVIQSEHAHDHLAVPATMSVNGSSTMAFRTMEEADEVVGRLNAAVEKLVAPCREEQAQEIVRLVNQQITTTKFMAFHD